MGVRVNGILSLFSLCKDNDIDNDNNFINVSVRSSLHIRKLIGDTYLLVN